MYWLSINKELVRSFFPCSIETCCGKIRSLSSLFKILNLWILNCITEILKTSWKLPILVEKYKLFMEPHFMYLLAKLFCKNNKNDTLVRICFLTLVKWFIICTVCVVLCNFCDKCFFKNSFLSKNVCIFYFLIVLQFLKVKCLNIRSFLPWLLSNFLFSWLRYFQIFTQYTIVNNLEQKYLSISADKGVWGKTKKI